MSSRAIAVLLITLIFVTNASSTLSPPCQLGTFQRGTSCLDCPPGTFQDSVGKTYCKNCPRRRFGPYKGAQGVDLCLSCLPNTFNNDTGVSSCKPCPPGSNSGYLASECFACGPGSRAGENGCMQCERNTYSAAPSNDQCTPCPEGYTAPAGSTTASACTKCPPGTEVNRSWSRWFPAYCKKCWASQFKGSRDLACLSCSPGWFSSIDGAEKCHKCPPGTFASHSSASFCTKCPPGTLSRGFGNTLCRKSSVCPSNFFRNRLHDCESCQPGFRRDLTRNKCVNCRHDQASLGGTATSCISCPEGSSVSSDRSFCACKPGSVRGKDGVCRSCPAGTAEQLSNTDERVCTPCRAGYFSKTPGSTECAECPQGTRAPNSGSATCIPCPPGTDSYSGGFSVCYSTRTHCSPVKTRIALRPYYGCEDRRPCAAGYFRDYSGNCITCEKGWERLYAPSLCWHCENNEVSDGGDSGICKACPPGFVNDSDDPSRCRCGGQLHFGRGLVDGKCETCPAGFYGNGREDAEEGRPDGPCRACPAGRFQDRVGSSYCSLCPAGFFTNVPGSASCSKCPPGTTSYGMGDLKCFPVVPEKELWCEQSCSAGEQLVKCLIKPGGKCNMWYRLMRCDDSGKVVECLTKLRLRNGSCVDLCSPVLQYWRRKKLGI